MNAEQLKSFRLEWYDRKPACLDARDEDHARELAIKLTGLAPKLIQPIYYRGLPVLDTPAAWPPYCLQPDQCAGKSFCTRSPNCDS